MLEGTNTIELNRYAKTLGVVVGAKMTNKQKFNLINEMLWDKFLSKDPEISQILEEKLKSLSNNKLL